MPLSGVSVQREKCYWASGKTSVMFHGRRDSQLLENWDLWCYIVITMKRTQIAIRRIGNSHGIVIPKPLLAQIGLEGHAEMTIERDALVLRRPAKAARTGWAAAAQKVAEHDDDALVMGEFGNEEDAELSW
jgi:antitoxin MazE